MYRNGFWEEENRRDPAVVFDRDQSGFVVNS